MKTKLGKLLEDLDFLKQQAERSVVCPPNFGSKQRIERAYESLRKYLNREMRAINYRKI